MTLMCSSISIESITSAAIEPCGRWQTPIGSSSTLSSSTDWIARGHREDMVDCQIAEHRASICTFLVYISHFTSLRACSSTSLNTPVFLNIATDSA